MGQGVGGEVPYVLPESLNPQTVAEEAGNGAYAKLIQKAKSRFG